MPTTINDELHIQELLVQLHQLEELIRSSGWHLVQADLHERIVAAGNRLAEGDPRDSVAMAKAQAERKALMQATELPLRLLEAVQAAIDKEGKRER